MKVACRVIDGRPVSCRTCKFVLNPRFPLSVGFMEAACYRPICCRVAPPQRFDWAYEACEPFCGQYQPTEGEAREPFVDVER